jgi:hypothetical protein
MLISQMERTHRRCKYKSSGKTLDVTNIIPGMTVAKLGTSKSFFSQRRGDILE